MVKVLMIVKMHAMVFSFIVFCTVASEFSYNVVVAYSTESCDTIQLFYLIDLLFQ